MVAGRARAAVCRHADSPSGVRFPLVGLDSVRDCQCGRGGAVRVAGRQAADAATPAGPSAHRVGVPAGQHRSRRGGRPRRRGRTASGRGRGANAVGNVVHPHQRGRDRVYLGRAVAARRGRSTRVTPAVGGAGGRCGAACGGDPNGVRGAGVLLPVRPDGRAVLPGVAAGPARRGGVAADRGPAVNLAHHQRRRSDRDRGVRHPTRAGLRRVDIQPRSGRRILADRGGTGRTASSNRGPGGCQPALGGAGPGAHRGGGRRTPAGAVDRRCDPGRAGCPRRRPDRDRRERCLLPAQRVHSPRFGRRTSAAAVVAPRGRCARRC